MLEMRDDARDFTLEELKKLLVPGMLVKLCFLGEEEDQLALIVESYPDEATVTQEGFWVKVIREDGIEDKVMSYVMHFDAGLGFHLKRAFLSATESWILPMVASLSSFMGSASRKLAILGRGWKKEKKEFLHYSCPLCSATCAYEAMQLCPVSYAECPVIADLESGKIHDNQGIEFELTAPESDSGREKQFGDDFYEGGSIPNSG